MHDFTELRIVEFVGAGLFKFWQDDSSKKFANKSFCKIPTLDDEITADTKPMTIEELGGCFVLLCIGVVVGAIAFILEKIYFHHFVSKSRSFIPL